MRMECEGRQVCLLMRKRGYNTNALALLNMSVKNFDEDVLKIICQRFLRVASIRCKMGFVSVDLLRYD